MSDCPFPISCSQKEVAHDDVKTCVVGRVPKAFTERLLGLGVFVLADQEIGQ